MKKWIKLYLENLGRQGFSKNTSKTYACYLNHFHQYVLDKTKKRKITEITHKDIIGFQNYLYYYEYPKLSKSNSMSTQARKLQTVADFFRYLVKINTILVNPAEDLEMPKVEQKNQRRALKEEEVQKIIKIIDHADILGYRDLVMIEVLYTTGIRLNELISLKIKDIDFENCMIFVENGKGSKDRYVPMCDILKNYIREYLYKVRPLILKDKVDEDYLFLTEWGNRIRTQSRVSMRISKYCEKAEIKDRISAHHFRVTCGSLMLRNGASERYVQALLGHDELDSTEKYLSVLSEDIKNEHNSKHPRENEI